jgi:hypothetical protein
MCQMTASSNVHILSLLCIYNMIAPSDVFKWSLYYMQYDCKYMQYDYPYRCPYIITTEYMQYHCKYMQYDYP